MESLLPTDKQDFTVDFLPEGGGSDPSDAQVPEEDNSMFHTEGGGSDPSDAQVPEEDSSMFHTKLIRTPGKPLGLGLGLKGDRVLVTTVDPESPAEAANLLVADCLVSVNGILLIRENFESCFSAGDVFELGVDRDTDLHTPQ